MDLAVPLTQEWGQKPQLQPECCLLRDSVISCLCIKWQAECERIKEAFLKEDLTEHLYAALKVEAVAKLQFMVKWNLPARPDSAEQQSETLLLFTEDIDHCFSPGMSSFQLLKGLWNFRESEDFINNWLDLQNRQQKVSLS